MDDTRRERLAQRLQEELSTMLLRGEIKDHRVSTLVSFSYVRLARDGSTARIGVSSVLPAPKLDQAVAGLNSATGFLHRRLGRSLRVRQPPRLHFVADHSIEEGQDVIARINELTRNDERDSSSEQSDGD